MLCLARNGVLSVVAGAFAVLGFLSASAHSALAAPIFLGPMPYLSSADSPFDLSGLGTTMFLEDFEDGELNTPGVSVEPFTISVRTPAFDTDSVDADDGLLDGFGTDGHSARSEGGICHDSDPPVCTSVIVFDFSPDPFGRYPIAAGIVLTDAFSTGTEIRFIALNSEGGSLGGVTAAGFLDSDRFGGTAEDRFFGVFDPAGIGTIAIGSSGMFTNLIEVDHLQYGVPEPATAVLFVIGTISLLAARGRSCKSPSFGAKDRRDVPDASIPSATNRTA